MGYDGERERKEENFGGGGGGVGERRDGRRGVWWLGRKGRRKGRGVWR